jgi:hypothetical protein
VSDFLFTVALALTVGFISRGIGIMDENTRIYEQCIQKNSELSVTKATELCKEMVK